MKRPHWLAVLLGLILLLASCGASNEQKHTASKPEQLRVFTTVYPLSYFASRIAGSDASIRSVYPPGSDAHSFEPTQKDMMEMADADLLLCIGLGMEGFIANAEQSLANSHVKIVSTGDAIPKGELLTGDEHDHDGEHAHEGHEHGEEGEHAHEGHEHGDIDPHVWLSPRLSIHLAGKVRDALTELRPSEKEVFEKRFASLKSDLLALDADYTKMAKHARQKAFYVSHASFGYIARDYGLEQHAIAGIHSQDEPSQSELASIIKQARAARVRTILFEPNISSKLSETITTEIGAERGKLQNMSVLMPDSLKNGDDYLTISRQNIKALAEALS